MKGKIDMHILTLQKSPDRHKISFSFDFDNKKTPKNHKHQQGHKGIFALPRLDLLLFTPRHD